MLVKYWMTRKPLTIDATESMQQATRLMKDHKIRLLPVLKKGALAGVVTDRDLKRASASDATTLEVHELLYLLSRIKVADIMSKPPVTVPFDFTIEETAELMLEKKISGAPVLDNHGEVIGVITQSDLFRALVSLTGLQKRGIHIGLLLEDRPGTIMEAANLIREAKARIVSIMTSYHDCKQGFRRVYFRIYSLERGKLNELLENLRQVANVLYMVDHRENVRRIFIE